MKTYILKRTVYNDIDFPVGTIVKLLDSAFNCFEVVEGKLTGKGGAIADGINGFIIDDTPENRALALRHLEHIENLEKQFKKSFDWADHIPEPNLKGTVHETQF